MILPDATMEPDSTSMRPSILIVEDNADISYYIGRLLNGAYQIIYAQNGAEGLEIAAEQMPDLILTDLMMPEMDGYELCRRVRESEVLNHIPIIIITAKSGGKERVCGLEVGADAYLEKPFNAEELNIRITKLLEQRRLLREKYSKAMREGTELNVKLNPADQDFLARLNDYIYALISNHGLNSDMVDDKMCMSRSQLNRKVRAITGYNTSAYILQMRMERSKRLLASTEELIGDIALKCGFEDANYFARLFKQIFNVTHSMIPCSGYFRVERGYEIEKSIFNLIIGKSEGIDIEFRIEILDGQIATLVNHRDRSGGVGCTWKYIINQSGYNPSSRITLVYRASVTMGNVTCLQWAL